MKKTVGIVECGNHHFLFDHSYLLFESWMYADIFYVKNDDFNEANYKNNLIRAKKAKIKIFKSFSGLLLNLFLSKNIKLIYFQTGPETRNLFEKTIYLLYLKIETRPKILCIRNFLFYLDKYNRNKITNFINKKILQQFSGFCFESKTQAKAFKQNYTRKADIIVTYDKYPFKLKVKKQKKRSKQFVVGLLGGVVDWKRDYSLVLSALQKIPQELLENLKMIFLGFTNNESKPIINSFQKICKVQFTSGFLNLKDFLAQGNHCDILLAPLRTTPFLNRLKSSGCFGDSQMLGKNLIIPIWADPTKEFSRHSFYYKNHTSLAKLLLKIFRRQQAFVNFKQNPIILSKIKYQLKKYYNEI